MRVLSVALSLVGILCGQARAQDRPQNLGEPPVVPEGQDQVAQSDEVPSGADDPSDEAPSEEVPSDAEMWSEGAPSDAEAQWARARVRLTLPACTLSLFDLDELVAIFRVEMASEGRMTQVCRPGAECADAGVLWVARLSYPSCEPDVTTVVATAQDRSDGRVQSQLVRLDEVAPEARSRVLALAMVELLRRGPDAPDAVTPPPASPTATAAPPPTRTGDGAAPAAPEPGPAPMRLGLSAKLMQLADLDAGLFGADLSASVALAEQVPMRLLLSVSAATGSAADDLGRIRATLVSGVAGVLLESRSGRLSAELGPALRVGWLRGWGQPEGTGPEVRTDDITLAAELDGTLYFHVRDGLALCFGLTVGHTLRGITLQTGRGTASGLDGPYVAQMLGVAFVPHDSSPED